jgi:hypothetical protein
MADPPPDPDALGDPNDAIGVGRGRDYPGTPRWVYLFGIIVLILVLLLVVVLVIGGHGPARHIAPPGVIVLGALRPRMPVP